MSEFKLIKKDITFRNVGKIFGGSEDAPLRIPDYQRSYAWTTDEINDFVRDLKELKDLRVSGSQRTHFLGGIVVFEEEKDENFPKRIHYVIDGQQRLITLQVTIAVIQQEYRILIKAFEKANDDAYITRTKNKINEIEKFFQFQFTTTLGDEQSVPMLMASDRDQDVFKKVLKNEDTHNDSTKTSQKRIRSARTRIRKNLVNPLRFKPDGKSEVEDTEYFKRLGILLNCLKDDCHVIYIVCPNLDDAYELFQVLNDRGKSLTDGDLLRAHTFQRVHILDEKHDYYDSLRPYWDEILSNSDGTIKRFLEQYLRVHTGERAQTKQLYRQFREKIFDTDLTKLPNDASAIDQITVIRDRVMDLRGRFRVFTLLLEGEWPYETMHSDIDDYDISRFKFLINILGLQNLSIFLAAQEHLNQLDFRKIVYVLERFFFRFRTVCGGSAVSIGDTFGHHANLIQNSKFELNDLIKDLRDLIELEANDEIFKANIRSNLTYQENNKHVIKYFLLFVEDYRDFITGKYSDHMKAVQDQKLTVPVIKKSSTIEHIYPQNPLPGQEQPKIKNNEMRGNLTNSIGNLTILGRMENSSLGNKAYSDKRDTFKDSNLWINRKCAEEYPNWDDKNLLARENWLLDSAVKVFTL